MFYPGWWITQTPDVIPLHQPRRGGFTHTHAVFLCFFSSHLKKKKRASAASVFHSCLNKRYYTKADVRSLVLSLPVGTCPQPSGLSGERQHLSDWSLNTGLLYPVEVFWISANGGGCWLDSWQTLCGPIGLSGSSVLWAIAPFYFSVSGFDSMAVEAKVIRRACQTPSSQCSWILGNWLPKKSISMV